jgi:crotonobetaine/carnitine-CoA ligase
VFLIHLPLYHVISLSYSLLATLWAGGTAVLLPRFSASRFWTASLLHRCTWASMVPFCMRALGDMDVPPGHAYRAWGNAFWSAGLEARYGLSILGWWGMTEMVTHPIVGDPGKPGRTMAIGRPAPEYGIAIQRDDGTPAALGEVGNLLVRGVPGVSIFAGYLDDADATADSFDGHGYFKTGDRVVMHSDGFIQFSERLKDVLKIGGENAGASEIERVIMQVPGIREVAVVGKPHPMLQEVPVAFVLAVDPRAGLADEILARCRANLAEFKVPREVHLVDELPRGTIEKVSKVELRRRLAAPSG